jgi:hypothetical protein
MNYHQIKQLFHKCNRPTKTSYRVRDMVFKATFNNISAISLFVWSVLLVEDIGVPGENHRPEA